MIWALIFVRAIGLGPLAGIMAIAISDIGTLSKLFSEAIENIDRDQMDGIKAAGANRAKTVRFGVVPQVLPVMLSFALYMFESNTRSATILGIVGAGGIGLLLADRIRTHVWDQACMIIIMNPGDGLRDRLHFEEAPRAPNRRGRQECAELTAAHRTRLIDPGRGRHRCQKSSHGPPSQSSKLAMKSRDCLMHSSVMKICPWSR